MDGKIITEINRMRQIMSLPLLVEAAASLPGLRMLALRLSDMMTGAPKVRLQTRMRWKRPGAASTFDLTSELFNKVKQFVDDLENGRITADQMYTRFDAGDISELMDQLDANYPSEMMTIRKTILDNSRGVGTNRSLTEVEFISWVKNNSEQRVKLDNNGKEVIDPQTGKPELDPITPYRFFVDEYGDLFIANVLDEFYVTNKAKVGKGEVVIKQKAPNPDIEIGKLESFYLRIMNTVYPKSWQKWKQRWLISISDPNCKGFLGCLWSLKGEAFRGDEGLRRTIDDRLDKIANMAKNKEKISTIQGELEKVINSINNLGYWASQSMKKEFLSYIVENEHLPKELLEGVKNQKGEIIRPGFLDSPTWKLIEKNIEFDITELFMNQAWIRIRSILGLIPVPIESMIRALLKGVDKYPAIQFYKDLGSRIYGLITAANPKLLREMQAASASHGLYGDQAGLLIDLIIVGGLVTPGVKAAIEVVAQNELVVKGVNQKIQRIKEFCESINKDKPPNEQYNCNDIEKINKIERSELTDAFKRNNPFNPSTFKIGDYSPKEILKDVTGFDELLNGWDQFWIDYLDGKSTIDMLTKQVEDAQEKHKAKICEQLKRFDTDCTKYKTIDDMLIAWKKLKDAKDKDAQAKIEQEKAYKQDSTITQNLYQAASNQVGFIAFTKAYNLGLPEDQQLKAYVWCSEEGIGFTKNSRGEEQCWTFERTPGKVVGNFVKCPSYTDFSSKNTACYDSGNNIYYY